MAKIKLLISALFFMLALTILIGAQENSGKEQLIRQYSEALYLIGDKEYDQAISKLKEIIEKEPPMSRAYKKIAIVYRKKKDEATAIAYFKDLIGKNQNNPYANHVLGWLYLVTKQYEKAGTYCLKAIKLNPLYPEGIKDYVIVQQKLKKMDEAEIYLKKMIQSNPKNFAAFYGLAYLYQLQYQWDKALQNINSALELKKNFLMAYITKQTILWYTNNYQECLKNADKAFRLAKQKNDLEYQVNFLTNIGLLQSYLSKNTEALENYQQALEIAKKIGYRKEEMRITGNMGVIYRDTGQLEQAVTLFEKSYLIAKQMGNKRHEGLQLRNMGDCYGFMGKYQLALNYFHKASPIIESLGDKYLESLLYWSQGLLNENFGYYAEALAYNQKALHIAVQQNDKWGMERYLNSVGFDYNRLGNYIKALNCHKKALAIAREIDDKFGQQLTISNIGIIYEMLGNYENALKFFNDALNIARETKNKIKKIEHLTNIGTAYRLLENYDKALAFYNQALQMSRELKDKRQESILLTNIGDDYTILGKYEQAKTYLNRALRLSRETGDKSSEATQLLQLGDVVKASGNYKEALNYYFKANQIGKMLNEVDLIWRSFMGLGICYNRQKQYQKSLTNYEFAINQIEKMRQAITTDKFKTGFWGDKIQLFENVIALLEKLNQKYSSKNYDEKAFLYAEKAKSRALLDLVFEGKIFQNLNEIPTDFREKFLINEKKNSDTHQKLSNELTKPASEQDKKSVTDLRNQIESLQIEKSEILMELEQTYPGYYQLTNPEHLSVQDIQKSILTKDQILVEYLVGEEKIYVWVISKDNLEFDAIDLSAKDLETEFARISPIFALEKEPLETQIDFRWANFNQELLHDLYLKLFKQPTANFLNRTKEIIIIPDGLLFYFPFEMLVTEINKNKPRYLVEDFAISYSSSASLLNPELRKKRSAPNELLAFGNPDFKAKKKGILEQLSLLIKYRAILRRNTFLPLPNAELEVKKIAENFSTADVFTGKDANESRFKELAKHYKNIHLATHFLIDDSQPMYSKIVLSQSNNENEDGLLQTYEIYNLRLNADMVVLSGCNTGLGELKRGEGLIGITRAFLYAGVPTVVVSLWPVDDESTALLMSQFYQFLKKGFNKNQALQQAKIKLINSDDKKRDPFFWAPFVLIGR